MKPMKVDQAPGQDIFVPTPSSPAKLGADVCRDCEWEKLHHSKPPCSSCAYGTGAETSKFKAKSIIPLADDRSFATIEEAILNERVDAHKQAPMASDRPFPLDVEPLPKPVILLDCDGVLADYVTAYLQIVNTKLGFNYIPSDVKGWDIAKELRLSTLDARMVAYHSKLERFCAKINPYPWALDLYEYLKATGDVRIVTTPQHCKHWHWERLEWLDDFLGVPAESVIFAHDKTIIDGAMLIDDNVQTVVKWAEAHPKALGIIWTTPHNDGLLGHDMPQNVVRVHNLAGLKSFMAIARRS